MHAIHAHTSEADSCRFRDDYDWRSFVHLGALRAVWPGAGCREFATTWHSGEMTRSYGFAVVAATAPLWGAIGRFGGGGGLGRFLVRLFIWHAIWRFALLIWHIPTFGPPLLVLIIAAVVTGGVFAARRRRISWYSDRR